MEKSLISIITPVYNTERYVKRCIDSILTQSYKNIELILVDDGSIDSSGKICDCYANNDNRVKVIHQANCGVSVARNKGLALANGKFVMFVDSDDELLVNSVEELLNCTNECELVLGGMKIVGKNQKYNQLTFDYSQLSTVEIVTEIMINDIFSYIMSSACAKLFRMNIIKDFKINFDTSLINGEDGLFVLVYLSNISKIRNVSTIVYVINRYEPEERVHAVYTTYPDFFYFYIMYFQKLWNLIYSCITPPKFLDVSVKFIDNLIANLVKAFAYEDFFKDKTIPLDEIVQNELVKKTIKVYKRRNKSYSLLIPLFIRLKTSYLLRQALKHRAKKYINSIGKSNIVKSIYRKY
ncbi:MAG: glycosyltransferase [Fibromonadaceae bacterium]|jgi:glycosyltransferase involved in cell wall biosynthesis|nr:glycosyltransferase [Fibromonadaceae bacterium]